MPRRTRSYGRPGTTIIPDDWAASHGVVVSNTWMTATVNLRIAGVTSEFNELLGRTVTGGKAPFATDVPANISALTESTIDASNVVDDQVRILSYLVTVPIDTAVDNLDEGILLDIAACPDPLLVGKTLVVTDIVRGTRLLERALLCTLNT